MRLSRFGARVFGSALPSPSQALLLSRPKAMRPNLLQPRRAQQCHVARDLRREDADCVGDPGLAGDRAGVVERPADEDEASHPAPAPSARRCRAGCRCRSSPDSPGPRLHDARQHAKRCDRAVELAPAVVRHDDAVGARLRARAGVVGDRSTPFTTSLPCQRWRISARWCQFRWSRAPRSRNTFDDRIGAPRVACGSRSAACRAAASCAATMPNSQRGWVSPPTPAAGWGAAASRSRRGRCSRGWPRPACRAVTTRVPKPARSHPFEQRQDALRLARQVGLEPGGRVRRADLLHADQRRVRSSPSAGCSPPPPRGASTRSPRYADSAHKPIGAMPNGAA